MRVLHERSMPRVRTGQDKQQESLGDLASLQWLADLQAAKYHLDKLVHVTPEEFRTRIEAFSEMDDADVEGYADPSMQRVKSIRFCWSEDTDFGTFQVKGERAAGSLSSSACEVRGLARCTRQGSLGQTCARHWMLEGSDELSPCRDGCRGRARPHGVGIPRCLRHRAVRRGPISPAGPDHREPNHLQLLEARRDLPFGDERSEGRGIPSGI